MTPEDPFAAYESERTVIKPKPRASAASGGSSAPMTSMGGPEPAGAELAELGLLNPLVSAAGRSVKEALVLVQGLRKGLDAVTG